MDRQPQTVLNGPRGSTTLSPLTPDNRIDPALLDLAAAEMERGGVPGIALGIYHDGRQGTAGLGVTNAVHPLQVDGDTLFQVGSVSKTFTATAILQLVDAGRVSLDDPVQAYLPEFNVADPQVSGDVTVRDCVTHSCGWEGEFGADTGSGDDALALRIARMADLPQVTPLARFWSYNNTAYSVLGRIVEVVHGRPYEDVINDDLLTPLGMDGACFFASDLLHQKFAVGHIDDGGQPAIARPWGLPRAANSNGGLVASAAHMLQYARFQLNGATSVLSDSLRVAAFEPSGPANDTPEVGLSWWLDDEPGERVVSHGGVTNGQECLFAMIPTRQFALVVLTNAAGGAAAAQWLLAGTLRTYFGMDAGEPPADRSADVEEWLGTYETASKRTVLRREGQRLLLDQTPVTDRWDRLFVPAPSQLAIDVRPTGPDTMLIAPGDRSQRPATVLRDEQGDIRWLRISGRAAPRK
ncbi:serine hydrolase domain-containing protein [Pedococcus sp. P5_B7]